MRKTLCDKCFYAEKYYQVDDKGNFYRGIRCKKEYIVIYEEIHYNPFFKRKHNLTYSSRVIVDRRREYCRFYREKLKPLTEYFKK